MGRYKNHHFTPESQHILDYGAHLHIESAPELAALRGDQFHQENLSVTDDPLPLNVQGDCLEIMAEFQPETAVQFGLKVRCTPDGSEETWILCDLTRQLVTIEREKSCLSPSASHDILPARQVVRHAPLAWQPGEAVRLHVFLDKSVVEVFVNGRVTLSSRIYPTRSDSLGLQLFSKQGRVQVTSVDIWPMKSIW